MKNKLNSNKGSTLGLVLIALSVLSLLGVALISVGLVNYRIKIAEEKIKTAFYMAESGLDQAYGIILEEISEAVRVANIRVNTEIENFIEAERQRIRDDIEAEDERIRIGVNPIPIVIYDSIYVINDSDGTNNPDGLVDANQINLAKANTDASPGLDWLGHFQNKFTSHINTHLHLKLEDPLNYAVVDPSVSSNKPSVIEVGTRTIFGTHYIITLASSFDLDGTNQTVQLEFTISKPDEILSDYFVETHIVEIPKSPIWDNALVANENIFVSGGPVVVRGNVYANAVLDSLSHEWNVNDSRIGGIVVGTDSSGTEIDNSSVDIEGDVFTNSFTQIKSDNSIFNLTGDAFINSLVLQENTDGSSATFNGKLLTLDDIELNGRTASININGDFYGFSDGSGAVRHDQSSSIVINSPDINDLGGSSINIAGSSFLAGTVYVGLNNDFLYQTGESVSLRGNFKAYSMPLGKDLFWYDPFALINNSFSVVEKASHFIDVHTNYPHLLNWGHSTNTIDVGTVSQSIGAHINKGVILGRIHDIGVFEPIRIDRLNEFNTNLTNQFTYSRIFTGNPEIIEPLNADNEIVKITTSNVAIIGNGGNDVGIPTGTNITTMHTGQTALSGIIVTEGNVYIRGEITFRGLIVAGGNIYIEDNHPKMIRTDLGFILRKVHQNASLANIFIAEEPENLLSFVYLSTAGTSDLESLQPYKDLVDFKLWKKTN